jgi:hypothetical protein
MKKFLSLLNKFIPKELPKPMGRWSNYYCDVKTTQKIDLSNEDHCGPCGQYALIKQDVVNKNDIPNNIINNINP